MKSELQCRWCFAVDRKRVEAKVVKEYHYPDAMLLVLKCPKCEGETTFYNCGFSEPYLRQVMLKLESELAGVSSEDKRFKRVIDKLYPEYHN